MDELEKLLIRFMTARGMFTECDDPECCLCISCVKALAQAVREHLEKEGWVKVRELLEVVNNQQDLDPKITEFVNKHFWELL